MVIDSIYDFFESCPLLKDGRINVNYLGNEPQLYSIEAVPHKPVLKRYVDGGELRQFIFVFASREIYDGDYIDNIGTAMFYEEFADWVEKENRCGRLPELGTGFTPTSISAESCGFVLDSTTNTARFQIQMKFIYRKDY